MILTRYAALLVIGIIFGLLIAAGLFAYITVVGVITRLAIRTSTAKHILLYEDVVLLGAMCGNIVYLFQLSIPVGHIGLIIFGFFSGCFVGCLAMALEEVLQVFPIITHRMKLTIGIPILILSMALSKGIGTFIQLFIYW